MTNNQLDFAFPVSIVEFEDVSSLQELRNKLDIEARCGAAGKQNVKYRCLIQKHRYIYARCSHRGCSANLTYRMMKQDRFFLMKSNNMHRHSQAQRCLQLKFQAVRQFLTSLPATVPPTSLRHSICTQFSISPKQLYYIIQKHQRVTQTPRQLIIDLENQGYEVYQSEQMEEKAENSPPNMIIIVNSEMKRQFRQVGEVISFDLTFKMVKDQSASGGSWKLGCFLGTSISKRMVPLALVLTLYENTEAYASIMSTFFRAMEGQPAVLITDEEKAIGAALSQMKKAGAFHGIHLLDSFHILRNVRKKLQSKEGMLYFWSILHARNKAEFDELVAKARAEVNSRDQPVLDRFLQRANLYCFSQIEARFFGLTSTSSSNQSLHSLLKKAQPSQKPFAITVRNALNVMSHLLKRASKFEAETRPYEDHFKLPQLKVVRMILAKPIFAHLIDELANSIRLEVINCEQDRAVLKEKNVPFVLQRQGRLWQCRCLYFEKAALPCRHQLKLLVSSRHSFLDYISPRWKCSFSECQPQKERVFKMGRERSCNRVIRSS